MNLFNIMAASNCDTILPIVKFIRNGIMPIIQFGIPIILIVMGSLDLGKAVMSQDEKEIKGATGKLIKRVIAAIIVFFVPFIVNLAMNLVSTADDDKVTGNDSWSACWDIAGK